MLYCLDLQPFIKNNPTKYLNNTAVDAQTDQ